MPYTFHVESDLVWVRYFGRIDAHDMIAVSQDQTYLAHLRTLKKVFYDYQDVSENQIVLDEVSAVADITRLEAFITDGVKVALLPSDALSRQRMEHYTSQLEGTTWQFAIVSNRDEGKAFLQG